MKRAVFAAGESRGAASFELLRAVWKHRRHANVLLVEGVLPQMWAAVFQKYLPGCRLPVIVTECLWDREPPNPKGRLKSALMRWMIRRFDLCVLYSSADVPRFADHFQAPPSKFAVVTFHETLRPERYPTVHADNNYIFAGGNSDRDYRCLIDAVKDLDVLCFIACSPQTLAGLKLPANVCRVEANHLQFRQLMSGASLIIVPMREGKLRSAGQQTFLNAMKLGKPVIVTDPAGAADYIVNNQTGVLCTASELRDRLRELIDHPQIARAIGARAREAAAVYTVENTYDQICALADRVACKASPGIQKLSAASTS